MNIILDLGVAALFLMFVYSGYKRGIIYMAINIGGTIASAIISSFAASLFSLGLYNAFFKQMIINTVTDATNGITATDPAQKASEVMKALSNFTRNAISLTGITEEELARQLKNSGLSVPDVIEGMVRATAVRTISTILTMIFFIICMLIVSRFAIKFTRTIDRTALRMPNRIAGAVVGAAQSLMIVMIIALTIHFVSMFISPENNRAINDAISKTWLYLPITKISIPDAIISWLSMK